MLIRHFALAPNGRQCEVSAIDCGVGALGDHQVRLGVYGTWASNMVGICNADTGESVCEPVQEIAHVASVRIRNGTEVLVGLGNGCLISYDLVFSTGTDVAFTLAGRKQLSLGVEPVMLSASASELQIEGSSQIVSLGERISVIHRERGRVMASSTSGKVRSSCACTDCPLICFWIRPRPQ